MGILFVMHSQRVTHPTANDTQREIGSATRSFPALFRTGEWWSTGTILVTEPAGLRGRFEALVGLGICSSIILQNNIKERTVDT